MSGTEPATEAAPATTDAADQLPTDGVFAESAEAGASPVMSGMVDPADAASADAFVDGGMGGGMGGAAGLDGLRAEVAALRKQSQDLQQLIGQWNQAVMMMQAAHQRAAPFGFNPGGFPPGAGVYQTHLPASNLYAGARERPPPSPPELPSPVMSSPPALSPPPTPRDFPWRAGSSNWTEHQSPDGQTYYYNQATNESRWDPPPSFRGGRGGGGGGMKTKGPPGANLFIVRKMRRGEYDDFSDEQLREAFARFGTLVRCEITVDKDTGARPARRQRAPSRRRKPYFEGSPGVIPSPCGAPSLPCRPRRSEQGLRIRELQLAR